MIWSHINYITKLEFLLAFKQAFDDAFTDKNVISGFRGAGLVPHDLEAVLSKLDIRLRTPTPPPLALDTIPWELKTPHNLVELASQTKMLKDRIAKHQNSSPTPINTALDQLFKGVQAMMHSAVLLKSEVRALQKANEAANRRRKRQKKLIRREGTLTIQQGQDLIDQSAVNAQIDQETRQGGASSRDVARRKGRCRKCGETNHNSRTCQKNQESL